MNLHEYQAKELLAKYGIGIPAGHAALTVEEAVANLKEATALYLSEFPLPAPGHPVVTMFSLPANA